MMTIEWVLSKVLEGVLRFDVSRFEHNNYRCTEGVNAELIVSYGDDEGRILGHVQFEAREGGCGSARLAHSSRPEEWATMVGDIIADWEPQWRTTSTSLCRLGTKLRQTDQKHWEPVSPSNLLMIEHLARMWGAIEQMSGAELGVDARFVLGAASNRLRQTIARQNSEIGSLTRYL